jgi:hypothetical protein
MRTRLTVLGFAFMLLGTPLAAQGAEPSEPGRYLLGEQGLLPEASASDLEKVRSARFGLRDPEDDFYDGPVDEMRVRWKLNRIKMRVPFSTASLR